MIRVPVYSPALRPEDAAAVARAVGEGQISSSAPPLRAFERAWAERCEMPHALGLSSGTAALELGVQALGLGPGDEVLCPALTIISCGRAIALAGATPVLVDVDPATWCIDPAAARARTGPRTRALLGVHMFGRPYDHVALSTLAEERDLLVIEDAAQAHGARADVAGTLRPCGGLGTVSVFSFFANKPVTTGEGGMLLSRDATVAERARQLSNLFFAGPRRFQHAELGHNYRLSSVQAALGLAQLERLDDILATKRRIGAQYRRALSKLEELELQDLSGAGEPIHWMNAVVLSDSFPAEAAELGAALARRGIESRPFFVGLHEQPALRRLGLFDGERYPVTERLSRRGLYLPSGLDLDEAAIGDVVEALGAALVEVRGARTSVPSSLASPPPSPDRGSVFGPAYAEAYDALYEHKDYAGEVSLLESVFQRFASRPVRRVLDLGCGTGRHAAELAARGYDVVGVDRSSAMLALARRRAPHVRFVEGDLASTDLGETFDAVAVLFAALGYQTTADAILRALETVRRHLTAGGLFIADVWLGSASPLREVPSHRTARRGDVTWERTGRFRRDPLTQRVDVAYELRRSENGDESVYEEVHSMHYFSPFELDFALRVAGFRLVSLSREGDLGRAPAGGDHTALFVAEAT